ncbi:hypothetical protein QTV43_000494 [Vibrio vulnificus]|nr:hypothetical protein [Vibrio vulnificus]
MFELVENFKINKKNVSVLPAYIPVSELSKKINSAYLIYLIDFTSAISHSELYKLLRCIQVDTIADFQSLPLHTIHLAVSKGFFVSHEGVIKYLKAERICASYKREPRDPKSIVSHNTSTNSALVASLAEHNLDTKDISLSLNEALLSNLQDHNEEVLLEHKSSLPIFMFKSIRNQMDFDKVDVENYQNLTNRARAKVNDLLLANARERIVKGKSLQSCIASYKGFISLGYSFLPRAFNYNLEPSEKLLCNILTQLNKIKA